MTVENILMKAQSAGLTGIALTDHIHPGEAWKLARNIPLLRAQTQAVPHTLRVYAGAELSAYGEEKYTLKNSGTMPEYRLYAHNHYHMFGWEQPEDTSPEGYKEHCRKVMTNVIRSGLADCLAHPFNDHYIVREFGDRFGFRRGDITDLWTDNEIGDLLLLGAQNGVAWEINAKSCRQAPEFNKRLWNIGKETGACFLYGSDSHVLSDIADQDTADFIRMLLR